MRMDRADRTGISTVRRRTALAAGVPLALVLTALAPATPASAVTPGQGYQAVRQLVVDGDDDLAVNPATGDVYVVDDNFDRLKRYSAAGALLRSVDLDAAGGVEVGPQGWVYVVDDDRVAILDAGLDLIGHTPVENVGLTDVAVGASGDIYVTDVVDDEVIHYAANGSYVGRWGGSGSGAGQLDNPQSIAVGPGGDVYVGERWNNRVSRFGPGGDFRGTWGQVGTGNGAFQWPIGLATDAQGNVYVADYADGGAQGGRIQVFTATGAYLTSIGSFGNPPFKIFGPRDVDVDPGGQVHVLTTDASASNVVVTFAPAVAATGTGKAKIVKPKGAAKLQGKRIRITLTCVKSGGRCTGVVTVAVKGTTVTKPKSYAVKPGRKKTITVKTTKPGRKVLRKKAVTKAVVTAHGSTRKIKIRR
ncbi:hypothetical protein GCM10009788_12920 [Nocardioides humi]|uniref:NHL repeat-containing protein n=1 Tax=Nocardioides humi TaxID=449461 RepID=A0ABN2A2C6_9ACTN